jgi:hypothetical protein
MSETHAMSERSSFQIVLATKLSEPVLRSLPALESADMPATTVFEISGDRLDDVLGALAARGHEALSIRVCHRRQIPTDEEHGSGFHS